MRTPASSTGREPRRTSRRRRRLPQAKNRYGIGRWHRRRPPCPCARRDMASCTRRGRSPGRRAWHRLPVSRAAGSPEEEGGGGRRPPILPPGSGPGSWPWRRRRREPPCGGRSRSTPCRTR
ncbi:hypothetical protein BMON_1900 [Bifidobacterium mongoliense DSM 21395]|uniref:Uncharacterized protein n=1 Tax=Bifidobacterium mongoliense DSM 21395 TaxID=1437603 RepID=A0A087C7L8_9BIFI|nr:hypothetical protein BMON_1900 [Bifidobacterium mongoliense DSM 21395]